jgi:hypothetical protein
VHRLADDPARDALVELRETWGALTLARSRGVPDPANGSMDEVADAYATARRRIGHLLSAAGPGSSPDEWRAYACSSVGWMDEWEAPPEDAVPDPCIGEAGRVPDAGIEKLRRATMAAYGQAASAITLPDGSVTDRLSVLERLATTDDEAGRRSLFLTQEPVWQAVDGDGHRDSPYRRLVASDAERWRRHGSPIDGAAAAVGIDPSSFEAMLRRVLEAFRALLGGDRIEPWNLRYLTGQADRILASSLPLDRLIGINDAHLASLGASPADLGIRYDILPRPGRPIIPVAFTMTAEVARRDGEWLPARPWVFATYETGGLGNLTELLHESGHAIHYAAIRADPWWFEPWPEDGGLVEGIADVVAWDAHEPGFQDRYLGRAAGRRENILARYDQVVLDVCWTLFEIEVHRHPDRRPNDVWAEITSEGLGIAAHPEWSWWATRGQLIDGPGYMANYALAALVAAAVRARLRELRGDWTIEGDQGWYPALAQALLRFGGERRAGPLLVDFLGGPLPADPLLEDLGRL